MKKYYAFTFYMWLILSVLTLGIAVWKYLEQGSGAWWFFVAFAVSAFLCFRRYTALKNVREAEKKGREN